MHSHAGDCTPALDSLQCAFIINKVIMINISNIKYNGQVSFSGGKQTVSLRNCLLHPITQAIGCKVALKSMVDGIALLL